MDSPLSAAMRMQFPKLKDDSRDYRALLSFLEDRLAAHEGGNGNISIGYDDATFHYVVSQRKLGSGEYEIISSSGSMERAIFLAVSGKKFD